MRWFPGSSAAKHDRCHAKEFAGMRVGERAPLPAGRSGAYRHVGLQDLYRVWSGPSTKARCLTRAAEVVPGIGHTEPEAVRIGVRPIPADGLSAVGSLDQLAGYYLLVTHT
jgi:hypothetical protein